MFFGTHALRLDEKGRLALPARYRDELAEGLVITKGQEHCLFGYPVGYMTRIAESLAHNTAPGGSRAVREYERFLFGSADNPTPDKAGRVVVRQELRDYAGLDRDCVVVGANTRFEIWESSAWARFVAEREDSFSDLEAEVLPRPI
ncbi:MAG: division/cell wall cluster transcriptional repressor MraZ [Geodermatophilaceae bacterium]|nr:division/cell wall cluster transcriptional repressor MraZ [Geodermatophilaceae bacterium]